MRSAGGDLSHVSQAHAAYLDATRRLLMEHMVDSTLSRFAAQQQQQRRNVIVNNSSSKSSADESEFGAASSTADCATEISIINQNSRAHSPLPPSQQQQPQPSDPLPLLHHPSLFSNFLVYFAGAAGSQAASSSQRSKSRRRRPCCRHHRHHKKNKVCLVTVCSLLLVLGVVRAIKVPQKEGFESLAQKVLNTPAL